jgi:hypothetical protein
MSISLVLFLLADAVMVAAAVINGWRFLKKRNYLLGLEWWIVGLSGTNFFVYSMTNSPTLYNISYFFDAFSRAFGFPVITIVGMMAVTHHYKPSTRIDILLFVLSTVGSLILLYVPALAPIKPYFYLLMWSVYSAYLAYFAWRLWKAGARNHALGMLAVLVSSQVIATIYDFYHIPGDDDQHTLFYIAALSTWAFALWEQYFAYCALERSEKKK